VVPTPQLSTPRAKQVPKKRKGRKRGRTRNPDSIKASKRKFAKHRLWAGHYMTAGNCKKGPMTLFRFGTCNVCMSVHARKQNLSSVLRNMFNLEPPP
jgi:hypothetical protein